MRGLCDVLDHRKYLNSMMGGDHGEVLALSGIIDRLGPQQAEPVYAELALAIARARDTDARCNLAHVLAKTARRVEPGVARTLSEPAIHALTIAFERETDMDVREKFAQSLASLAEFLGPGSTSQVFRTYVDRLMESLENEVAKEKDSPFNLAAGFGAILILLPRDEAVRYLRKLVSYAEATTVEDMGAYSDSYHVTLFWSRATGHTDRLARVLFDALKQEKNVKLRWRLTGELCATAEKMSSKEAERIYRSMVTEIIEAITTRKDGPHVSYDDELAHGLEIASSELDRARAGELAGILSGMIERADDNVNLQSLARALVAVAGRMEAAEAARVCRPFARSLVAAIEPSISLGPSDYFAETLVMVAGRLEPAEAARVCGPVARALADAIEQEREASKRRTLGEILATGISDRLEPAEAARLSGRVARSLAVSIERENGGGDSLILSEALGRAAGRLEPAEAARLCNNVISRYLQARSRVPRSARHESIESLLKDLMPYVDPGVANVCAREWSTIAAAESDLNVHGGTAFGGTANPLAILTDNSRAQVTLRLMRIATAIVQSSATMPVPAAGIAAASQAEQPWPCRLATQELVDLLKMPTCFGKARRVVLDHLGNRYGRRFVNHWAFVRFAKERNLGLDFTTPPRRPDPEESLKRILEALGGPAAGR